MLSTCSVFNPDKSIDVNLVLANIYDISFTLSKFNSFKSMLPKLVLWKLFLTEVILEVSNPFISKFDNCVQSSKVLSKEVIFKLFSDFILT